MSDDKIVEVLRIAASQWAGVPRPEQIVSALRAGGFEIVPNGIGGSISAAMLTDLSSGVVGRRVAEVRKSKGLSQEDLAQLLDCHWVTVSKLERNEMGMTADWLLKLAGALCVDPASLLSQTEIDDPLAYVRGVMERHDIAAATLAAKAGLAASTLTRALYSPRQTSTLSAKTLQRIKAWDKAQREVSKS